jgi:hypothetical protein
MLCRSTPVSAVIDPGATGELAALHDAEFVKAHTGIGPLELALREMLLLPGAPLVSLRLMPQVGVIYFITEGWSLQYIGSTDNLRNRMYDHRKNGQWADGAWVRWLDLRLLEPISKRQAEQRLIRTLQPERNIQWK